MKKYLLFSFFILLHHFLFAGEILNKYFKVQPAVNYTGPFIYWSDLNGKKFLAADESLPIIKGISTAYYLNIQNFGGYQGKYFGALTTWNNALDKQPVTDINVFPSKCVFSNAEPCRVTFAATESTPTSTANMAEQDQRMIRYQDMGVPGAPPFYSGFRFLEVMDATDGGRIDGFGLDKVAGQVSAIHASSLDDQDKVPLTYEVWGARNVRTIHLEYSESDPEMAQLTQYNCDINFIAAGHGHCAAGDIIPHKLGNTSIIFDPEKSYWITLDNQKKYYTQSQLNSVRLNIGSLYVAYQDNTLYRSGISQHLELPKLGQEFRGISQLLMDNAKGILYFTDGNWIYKIPAANDNSPNIHQVAALDSQYLSSQTLSFSNIPGLFFVGASSQMGTNAIFAVCDQEIIAATAKSQCNKVLQQDDSLISSALDSTYSNLVYLLSSSGQVIIAHSDESSSAVSWQVYEENNVYAPEDTSIGEIAADSNNVYISSNYGNYAGSHLYRFESANTQLLQTSASPFESGNLINSLQIVNGTLYAAGSDGGIYSFSAETISWSKLVQLGNSHDYLIDFSADKNGNIYVAATSGIWKIPVAEDINHPLKPYKLTTYNYASIPNALVIVNQ